MFICFLDKSFFSYVQGILLNKLKKLTRVELVQFCPVVWFWLVYHLILEIWGQFLVTILANNLKS